MSDDAVPGLEPGLSALREGSGHRFRVTAVSRLEFTRRMRYLVECTTCQKVLSESTLHPYGEMRYHIDGSMDDPYRKG